MTYELTIVVPTFNERDNISRMINAVDTALPGTAWEIVFVDDDSPDGTARHVEELAQTDNRVRCIHRKNARGLSSACIEGILSAKAPFVAVMDADLQHDEGLLPQMLELLQQGERDLVIGSRHVSGGSVNTGLNALRRWISSTATWMSRWVLKNPVQDPMSGFFMMKGSWARTAIPHTYGKGFKILLDLMSSSPQPFSFEELPYAMRPRLQGESKLDLTVIFDYIALIAEKRLKGLIPTRFVLFSAVGATGIVVHLVSLGLLHRLLAMGFLVSQALATWIAMTTNFLLNNLGTFKDKQLRGTAFWKGLFSFYLACSLGAVVNVAVADFLFRAGSYWGLSGFMGALAGAIWNFALTSHFTWGKRTTLGSD